MIKKKLIKSINANIFVYLIFILLIAILFKNNKTFYSIYKISVSNYNERISKNYENIFYSGFCKNQSHGYLIYIKENFKYEHVPDVINFDLDKKIPHWVFGKINYKKSNKYLILLNYDKQKKNLINFSNYKIIDNYKDSCYFLQKND